MFPEEHQARDEDRRLQEGRQTQTDDLLAPAREAVQIAAGDAEHVQASHGDLDQQDAAALEIGEEHLDHGIGHQDDAEDHHEGAGDHPKAGIAGVDQLLHCLHSGEM